jgi:hypothetical protein
MAMRRTCRLMDLQAAIVTLFVLRTRPAACGPPVQIVLCRSRRRGKFWRVVIHWRAALKARETCRQYVAHFCWADGGRDELIALG